MKAMLRFISLLLVLVVAFFVLINVSNTIALETNFLSLRANVGFLILFCAVLGSIATLLFVFSFGSSAKQKEIKRQLERRKLNLEVESEKVKQLEAKIETLEEALRVATKQK